MSDMPGLTAISPRFAQHAEALGRASGATQQSSASDVGGASDGDGGSEGADARGSGGEASDQPAAVADLRDVTFPIDAQAAIDLSDPMTFDDALDKASQKADGPCVVGSSSGTTVTANTSSTSDPSTKRLRSPWTSTPEAPASTTDA
ncbi:hypothetical protein [Brachybacterium sp. NPDC056505]|uniref:hypothetical protein n=1 Tax=Brachybacterium sp. NPDC056505 TaxID=3345843 RepID=UPI003671757A